ncbi:MAG: metal-dependent hydrolase [Pirellulales bacterium]|nr:metal-dependent hydrolase [Pirellulales bacterium]
MAGFKTHITTSSLLGVGYTGVGLYAGLPVESALIAGGLCGIGGMLPDIDSDTGIPFRESMGFAAAIVPLLLLDRFRQFNMNYEQILLMSGGMYLFVRFGVAKLLASYTVHRGMFHSLPAAATFAGVAFLLYKPTDLQMRYFVSGGVLMGVMSHLILDEIYAIEWVRGRWRFKKSFGTAMKLWGKNLWANVSTYAKLVIVIILILGEPMVVDRYGLDPQLAQRREQWPRHCVNGQPQEVSSVEPPPSFSGWQPIQNSNAPKDPVVAGSDQSQVDQTIYDTARRIWSSLRGSSQDSDSDRR